MLRILSIATIVLLGATTPVPESLAVSPFETRTTAAESGATATPTPSSPTPTPSSPTPGGPSAPPSPGGPSPSSVPSPSASPISTPVPTVEPSSTPDPDASAEPAPEARTLKATALVGAESFATSDDWTLVSGRGTLSSSSDATEGGTSLKMDYDLSGGTFEIGKTRTPADIPSTGLRSLALDVKGDGTFNTLYLRLRDATGEVLLYRVGNINNTEWSTVTVDLSRAPAASTGGNGDQILDGPVSLFRIVVVKNGTQPTTGTARVDNLRVNDSGWTAPASTMGNVVPGKGTADITFQSGSAGDFRLRLIDPTGKTKTFQGTSATAKTERMRWDGKADDGSALAGIVRGVLEYDTTPNGALAAPMTIGSPYLVGAAQRTELETRGSVAAVNSSLTTYDSLARADNDAALMENAYVRYAREEFEWNRIEPRKGYFDWPKFDQAVSVARARNVDIIGKLVYSADWASSAPSGTPSSTARYYPPSDYADFVNYAVATVQRYKDEVKVWEVWNEPNIVQYWKPAPDASAYARLLNATYAAIKKVQPDAVVLTGGLAGWSEGYMNGMLQAGAMNSFDGFGLHTYVEGAPESSMLDTWIASAQSFLARNASSKPIWITETSWSTCTTCSAGQGVSETLQAQFLSRAMLDAVGHGVRGFAWYNLIEFGSSGSRLDNYGLVEQSGRRKPAYAAFAQTAAALAGSVSGGTVAPSTGTTSVVSDLASTTGITTRALGAGATSKLQATTSRVAGSGALALDYNHSASTAEGTSLSMSFPVAGQPSAISMWVYGDNSSSPVYLKVKDARGEFFEGKIGNAGPVGWSRQTLYFDGLNSNYKSYGANVDKKVDYPITVVEAHVFKSTTSKQSGRIILDDITAHYGTSMRGLTLYGRNFVTQAIYRDTASTTRLPVANTTAYTYDRGTLGALSVNDSLAATVTISPLPKFVVSTHLVTPSTVRQGQSVALRLIAGDRTNMTLQITDASGQLVRTLAVNVSYASGARNITWDGKRSDGTTAAAGGYRFRLQANGPDGRSVAWGRPFTIAP